VESVVLCGSADGRRLGEVNVTEDERLAEIDRLRTALHELCSPYQSDDGTATYDEVIKEMPETEQAMAFHLLSELEHLDAQGPG
jgi:hypothetical protein